jgi:hypothetical protein
MIALATSRLSNDDADGFGAAAIASDSAAATDGHEIFPWTMMANADWQTRNAY